MNNFIPNGAIPDPRPAEKIAQDFLYIGGAVGVNWIEKTSFKKYTQRNQDGSYSCGLQAGAKALECLTGKVISATPYFWRKNYPGEGTFMQDIGDILYNRYSCLEKSSPSQNQDEVTMNVIKPLTTNIGITGYRTLTQPNNIEQIAEVIEGYGQCIILLQSNGNEYTKTPVYNGQTVDFAHFVVGVDYGLVNGTKVIAIEDSAGIWSAPDGCRNFTADFISKRVYGGLYFLGAKDVSVPQDKKFIFNYDMSYGMKLENVRQLQLRLISEGYSIPSGATSYYGSETAKAVVKYQLDHGVKLTFSQRYFAKDSVVGPMTRASLNR